jgi:hypothetical protein
MKKKHLFQIVVALICTSLLIGCVAAVEVSTVKTGTPYKTVWNACLDSLADVRYAATSADPASGLIMAAKSIRHTTFRLNIRVERQGNENFVRVQFVPPGGAIVGKGTAEAYVKALQERIPDLRVVVAK